MAGEKKTINKWEILAAVIGGMLSLSVAIGASYHIGKVNGAVAKEEQAEREYKGTLLGDVMMPYGKLFITEVVVRDYDPAGYNENVRYYSSPAQDLKPGTIYMKEANGRITAVSFH